MIEDVLTTELAKHSVTLAFTVGGKVAEYLWGKLTRRPQTDPLAFEEAVRRLIADDPDARERLKALVEAELPKPAGRPRIAVRRDFLVDRVTAQAELHGSTGRCVLQGPSGIGKTAVAEHFALRSTDFYRDGAVLVRTGDFRADGPGTPLGRSRVRAYVLSRLGIEEISQSDDALAAQYDNVLGSLRLLLVFDDVESADELDGLVPTGERTLTLALTSAPAQDFALGFRSVPLGPLEAGADRQLLEMICSPQVVQEDPEGAEKLLAQCDRVPAALVMAAELVRSRSAVTSRPLATVAAELAAGGSLGPVSQAYDELLAALSDDAAELCRLLTVFPGPSFTPEAAAVLAGHERLGPLAELSGQLLVTKDDDGRLRLASLARQAVLRTGNTDGTGEAFARLVRFYAARAVQADLQKSRERLRLYDRALPPGTAPYDFRGDEVDWLVAELPTYRALAGAALDAGFHHELLQICGALEIVGLHRGRHRDVITILDRGIEADAPPAALARMTSYRARALALSGEFARAVQSLAQADAALARIREPHGGLAASVAEFHALVHREQGQYEAAEAWYRKALAISRQLRGQRAISLQARMLANVLLLRRAFAEAADLLVEAERNTLQGRDRAQVWLVRAKLFAATGRTAEAIGLLNESWKLANQAGSNQYDAEIAETLGDTAWRAGDRNLAWEYWVGVWRHYEAAGHPRRETLYRKLTRGLTPP